MNNYFRARPRAVALAWAGALVVLLFDLWLALQATPRVALVDGWAILNRIMQFENGDLSLDKFLFMPHGAHLHLAAVVPAWLDFRYAGGEQYLTQAMSLAATAVFCALFVWVLIREGVRTSTPALLILLGSAAAVALMSGLSDREMMYHPFQVVLSLARTAYTLLLLLIIKGLVEERLGMYLTAILASVVAVTFHGTGYIFAICVILAHLLVSRRIWMVALSCLPLLTAVVVQAHYAPPGGELSHLGSLLNLRTVREVLPGVAAFFVAPIWTLDSVIGVKPLLALGLVIFFLVTGLTIAAIMLVLKLRWGPPAQMWRALIAQRTGAPVDPITAFLAVMGIFLIASAFAATLFWLVRTIGPGEQLPIYHYVLYSLRYGAFACLAYVMIIVAMFRARFNASSVPMATWAGPVTAVFSALLLAGSLYASVLSARDFEEDNLLNVAAAGIATGLSPLQPGADTVWVGAKDDWYWADQLPLTIRYMRSVHKGFWRNLPPIGAQGGAFYAGYPIVGLKRTPVASDPAPGRCAISGTLPAGNTEYAANSLLLPVAGRDGVVVGYAALMRNQTAGMPRVISGFAECPGGASDPAPLYLAHDVQPANRFEYGANTSSERGTGRLPILPLTDVTGSLTCERVPGATADNDTVLLKLGNDSNFDWSLDTGKLPLRIGVHLLDSKGAMVRFDDGLRVAATGMFVPSHGTAAIRFPLSKINLASLAPEHGALTVQFQLVQDGHAWFNNMHCAVPLSR